MGGGCRVTKINRGRGIIYTGNIYKFQKCRCNTFVCRALTRFLPPGGQGRWVGVERPKSIVAEILPILTIHINLKSVGAILLSVEH